MSLSSALDLGAASYRYTSRQSVLSSYTPSSKKPESKICVPERQLPFVLTVFDDVCSAVIRSEECALSGFNTRFMG